MSTIVEARGVLCPVPIIRLARAAAELPAGSLLELLSDDPAAAHDVPAWCRLRGHELLRTEVLAEIPSGAKAVTPPGAGAEFLPGAGAEFPPGADVASPPPPRGDEPHVPNPNAGQGLRHVIRLGGAADS